MSVSGPRCTGKIKHYQYLADIHCQESDEPAVLSGVVTLFAKQVHLVENVQRRDEKYWLPGQPEEAYFCVRVR